MANRDSKDRNVRKLTPLGDSVGVTLPIELIRDLNWRVSQKVVVKPWGDDKLIIEDWKE